MFRIHVEQQLRAPAAKVWEVVQDFGSHHKFNHLIEHARITNGIALGPGAEREVQLYDGSLMRQRIIDFQPGQSMAIEVIESDHWIRHHLIEIAVRPRPGHACTLAYRISYQAPFGVLGFPIGLFYKIVLRSRYNHVLRGVERYVNTGLAGRPPG